MATLILVFKKIKSEDKQSLTIFIQTPKQKQLSMKVTLIMCFNQSILQLQQAYKNKNLQENAQVGLLIQSLIILLVFQSMILQKELYCPRKGLINIQNIDDNECFKWSMVRYLSLADCKPAKVTKADKEFAKKLDFKNTKFPVKIRDICKIKKKNSIGISAFGYGNKERHPI